MPRLIFVFAGRTAKLLGLSCRGSNSKQKLLGCSNAFYTREILALGYECCSKRIKLFDWHKGSLNSMSAASKKNMQIQSKHSVNKYQTYSMDYPASCQKTWLDCEQDRIVYIWTVSLIQFSWLPQVTKALENATSRKLPTCINRSQVLFKNIKICKYWLNILLYHELGKQLARQKLNAVPENRRKRLLLFSYGHVLTCRLSWCNPYLSNVMRKPVFVICEQQRRRSACASAQSDQHLCGSLLR